MSPTRFLRLASHTRAVISRRMVRVREFVGDRLPGFARDDRSGSDGVIWEPLVLTSFVIAAAVTGASAPVASVFGPRSADDRGTESGASVVSVPDAAVLSAPEPMPVVVPAPEPIGAETTDLAEADPGDAHRADDLGVPGAVSTAPLVDDAGTDRALISWWDEGRWESRDARAEQWRRDWLRIARRSPERVPLELWLSILDWAPGDERLVRSAARAADRYSSRNRGRGSGWRTGTDSDDRTRADVVAEIDQAVRDARRRAEYQEHKDDGPDSSWYRSLLRRLRGG